MPDPGWYPDSNNQSQLRYWDGSEWTDNYRPRYKTRRQADLKKLVWVSFVASLAAGLTALVIGLIAILISADSIITAIDNKTSIPALTIIALIILGAVGVALPIYLFGLIAGKMLDRLQQNRPSLDSQGGATGGDDYSYQSRWSLSAAYLIGALIGSLASWMISSITSPIFSFTPTNNEVAFAIVIFTLTFLLTIVGTLVITALIMRSVLEWKPSTGKVVTLIIASINYLAIVLVIAILALASSIIADLRQGSEKPGETSSAESRKTTYRGGDNVSFLARDKAGAIYRVNLVLPQTNNRLKLTTISKDGIVERIAWKTDDLYLMNSALENFSGSSPRKAVTGDDLFLAQGKGQGSNTWITTQPSTGDKENAQVYLVQRLDKDSNNYLGFTFPASVTGYNQAIAMVKEMTITKRLTAPPPVPDSSQLSG